MNQGSLSVDQTGVSKPGSLVGDLFQDPPPAAPVIEAQLLYIQMDPKMVVEELVNGKRSKHPVSKQGRGLGTTSK